MSHQFVDQFVTPRGFDLKAQGCVLAILGVDGSPRWCLPQRAKGVGRHSASENGGVMSRRKLVVGGRVAGAECTHEAPVMLRREGVPSSVQIWTLWAQELAIGFRRR